MAKKVRTLLDIRNDERIINVVLNYEGNKHLVECCDGWKFENERTIEIGTIKEICYSINEWLDPVSNN